MAPARERHRENPPTRSPVHRQEAPEAGLPHYMYYPWLLDGTPCSLGLHALPEDTKHCSLTASSLDIPELGPLKDHNLVICGEMLPRPD